MNFKDSNYLSFIDEATKLCENIPRYSSKFSNKIFCNHQKIILLVLKQKLNATYRSLIEWIKVAEDVRLMLGLNRIPNHTTLVKFAKKIKTSLLDLLLPYRKAKAVAVDATGFELESKSYYYRNIDKSLFNHRRRTKRFMKLSLSADAGRQLILWYKIRKGPRNDNIDFKNILHGVHAKYVLADKGYSSRKNRDFVIYKLKAKPVIPKKKNESSYKFRGNSKLVFDENIYHQRSKVETIFSVIKRKYGSCLRARSFDLQKKEVIFKLVAYNLDRLSKIIFQIILRVSAKP